MAKRERGVKSQRGGGQLEREVRLAAQDERGGRNREQAGGKLKGGVRRAFGGDGQTQRDRTLHREHQRGPLRQVQLADQPRRARRRPGEAHGKGPQRNGGQNHRREQDAGSLGHGFQYTWRQMRALDIIRTKRDGQVLTRKAIDAFVTGVTDGTWPDYQVSALLMAIFLRGMTLEEAVHLTQAMVESGVRLDWSDLAEGRGGGVPVDKHSTGGVGDKTSLVLAPLAAACGALVPMMSGRGLGHTGGTLDKLAAIPGFRTELSFAEMRHAIARTGCVLIRQTAEVAPADRKLYALRDATATVESVPLIAASILSKKVTEGIGALVLDVKVGSGGFMADLEHARELARWLVDIATRSGVRTEALLTRMDTPLGRRVGNASEVREAIATLKGEGPEDLEALSVRLAARMLVLAGIASGDEAERRVRDALTSGRGLETFAAVIGAQGGDPRVIDDPSLLPLAGDEAFVRAPRSGVVAQLHAGPIGHAAVVLGAGRDHADAVIDPSVGIDILAPVGTPVAEGDPVLRLYYRDPRRRDAALERLTRAVDVADAAPAPTPLVLETIQADLETPR